MISKTQLTGGAKVAWALSFILLAGLFSQCSEQETVVPTVTSPRAVTGNGVNLQPSYYNGGYPNFGWSLMKSYSKIKTVRIEIEPDKVTQAKSWIAAAKSNGYTVIATYHKSSVLGSDNASELTAAANWWKSNYNILGGGFIINLMNEWGSHNISSASYASAYNTAISIVRQVYGGQIIIDIPGWGQETATAACAVKGCSSGQTRINDTNIVLSAHIYPGAWNQGKGRYVNTSDVDDLASSGRPCMIGEFGNQGGSGADWSAIVDYARSKGWTVLGWSWNGDGGSMNMVSPSWASNGGATSFTTSSYFSVVYNKL
jgi:mannan endo-1,4-beta-mannosidase